MKYYVGLILVGTILVFQGCSTDKAKRLAYEVLENKRVQGCQRDIAQECPEREPYDEYERKRKEAQPPE